MTGDEAPIAHDADVVVAGNLAGTKSLVAVAGLFAVNGTLVGGIGATLPAMRVRLGVDAGGLAVVLVSLAAGALMSMQIGDAWPTAAVPGGSCCRRPRC